MAKKKKKSIVEVRKKFHNEMKLWLTEAFTKNGLKKVTNGRYLTPSSRPYSGQKLFQRFHIDELQFSISYRLSQRGYLKKFVFELDGLLSGQEENRLHKIVSNYPVERAPHKVVLDIALETYYTTKPISDQIPEEYIVGIIGEIKKNYQEIYEKIRNEYRMIIEGKNKKATKILLQENLLDEVFKIMVVDERKMIELIIDLDLLEYLPEEAKDLFLF
jgi:hypothetical protein